MRAKFGRGPTVVSKKGSLKFISRYVQSCNKQIMFILSLKVDPTLLFFVQEDLDAMPNKELGDVIRELKYRQGLAPLLLTLRDICGDPSHVKCHFILRSSKVAG